jgi:DNA-binding transcriptional ArsR family regulator
LLAQEQLTRVFSALADPVRRDIVVRLSKGEATVNELAAPYEMSLQAVSKHLKVLENAGVITRGRDAQRRPCRLNPDSLDGLAQWIERYRQRKEEQFERLDELLKEQAEEETPS